MAGDCITALVILLAIEFGASNTLIRKPLHQGDPINFQCGLDTNTGIKFLYSKNDSSLATHDCEIYVKDSLVTTDDCTFDNEAFDGKQSEGRLSITSFNEEHVGYWSCAAAGSPVFYLIPLIETVLHQGDQIDLKCEVINDQLGIPFVYSKNDSSLATEDCFIYVKDSLVSTLGCPFDNTALKRKQSEEGLSITSFIPGKHTGYWRCAAITDAPVYNLIGYAFSTITHTITKQVIEGKTKLECNLNHFYPSICESESGAECDNRADSLRWFKVTKNGLIELDADSLETSNDTKYEGLYQANSTLTLEFKDFEYRCVYQNFNGNRSTAIYPGPTVAVEPIAIGVGIVLVIIVIIIVTVYVIKNKKQQNEDVGAHLDKDQSKNVEL